LDFNIEEKNKTIFFYKGWFKWIFQ
jgi:hypothetical protein